MLIEGTGKTTLAAKISDALNERFRSTAPAVATGSTHPLAAFIPMDGYHLTRAQLSAMPDPDAAHARRGAAFTFDGNAFLKLIKSLREPLTPESKTLYAPSFDHAVKDPVDNDIPIAKTTRVLIFEGNYIALDEEPWREASGLMDEIWFVDVDEGRAKERLVERHVKAGIAKDTDDAAKRAEDNDLPNGREIVQKRIQCHEVIKSREDAGWKPDAQGGVES